MDDLGVLQGCVDAFLMLMHLIKMNPPILKHINQYFSKSEPLHHHRGDML